METIKTKVLSTIKWSEKYFKTDMMYVAKSGFWLNLNHIIGSLISFALSILFAYYVSKETYGIYKYILSIAGIAVAFSMTGINTAITRAVAQGYEGIFLKSIWPQFKWNIGQFLFTLAFSIYYFYNGNSIYGVSFIIVSVLTPISSVLNSFGAYLHGKKLFKQYSIYGILSNLLYLLLLSITIILWPKIIFLVLFYYLAINLSHIYFFFKTIKISPPNTLYREEDLTYGKKLSLMNIFGILASHLDNIIVYFFLGPTNLAIYNFAIIFPERIRSMFGFSSTIALPKLSDERNNFLSIKHKFTILILIGAVICIVYTIFAPFIFKVFYPEYIESVMYSQIFSVSLLFALATNITSTTLFAKKSVDSLYVYSVFIPIIRVVMSVVSVYFLGLWGAIIARVLSSIVYSLSSFFLVKKDSVS